MRLQLLSRAGQARWAAWVYAVRPAEPWLTGPLAAESQLEFGWLPGCVREVEYLDQSSIVVNLVVSQNQAVDQFRDPRMFGGWLRPCAEGGQANPHRPAALRQNGRRL